MQSSSVPNQHAVRLIQRLKSQNSFIASLVHSLLRLDDHHRVSVFERLDNGGFHLNKMRQNKPVDIDQNLLWSLLDDEGLPAKILPVRQFRDCPTRLWAPVDKLRIFLSSGTTSGPSGRSQSCFSHQGLDFYRASSVATFFDLMESIFGARFDDLFSIPIISLVPPVETWPDSSLAQMLEWFGKLWPIHYLSSEKDLFLSELKRLNLSSEMPVLLFGTGFHFVNLCDQGILQDLGPNALVIETGGTKGKSRSVSREELYSLISKSFGIQQEQIASEYGMCEMASQGWDFLTPGQKKSLATRTFQFPWWVSKGISSNPERLHKSGQGILSIYDPTRIDLPNIWFQTEDLAEVLPSGYVRLLGRVPKSPLKGCSLMAEKNASQEQNSLAPDVFTHQSLLASSATTAPKVLDWFKTLMEDSLARNALLKEFKSPFITQQIIDDLRASFPDNPQDLLSASSRSVSIDTTKRWLIIPPSNHSVACIFPLAVAWTLGFSLRVRLPSIEELPWDQNFLGRALTLAKKFGLDAELLNPSWRLEQEGLREDESILLFGADETVDLFKSYTHHPVKGFGHVVSLNLSSIEELSRPQIKDAILRDFLHLRQRGCLSSRCLIVVGGSTAILKEHLLNLPSHMDELSTKSSLGAQCAQSLEQVRLNQEGFQVLKHKDSFLFVVKSLEASQINDHLHNYLSKLELVLPIFILPEETSILDLSYAFSQMGNFLVLGATPKFFSAFEKLKITGELSRMVHIVPAGKLGQPAFDGTHLGSRFFAVP